MTVRLTIERTNPTVVITPSKRHYAFISVRTTIILRTTRFGARDVSSPLKDVRRVNFSLLPKAIRDAGISMIERKLATGPATDLVTISDTDWHQACGRSNAIQRLAEHSGRSGVR